MSDDSAAIPPVNDDAVLRAAENIIITRFGGTARLSVVDILREKYRNRVLRCAVQDAPASAPASVILKTVEGEGEHAYDPENDSFQGTAWRFYNEWAGNQFLDSLDLTPPLSAGFIGGDRAAGLIVLRDLGKEGKSLADWMTGTDRAALETALLSYAASMGRLHAVTIGKEAEFMAIRQKAGGKETVRKGDSIGWRQEAVESFRALCAAVDVTVPAALDAEIVTIQTTLDESGPFHAFSPGDTCPDNQRLTDTPYARFFDFEFAGFTHALITAAYFYLPFPSCWCVNRLPDEMVARMETTYRHELAIACPEAMDDTIFYPALLTACAFWTVQTLTWNWEHTLREDGNWGISTVRQRHLLRLGNFVALSEKHNGFPALRETASLLLSALRERFALDEEMPLYPSFRDAAGHPETDNK